MRVVAGCVEWEGRVLLAQRPAGKERAGFWEFPGGKVEVGESDREALIREWAEELAVQVQVGDPMARVRHRYSDRLAIDLHLYGVAIVEGTLRALEHSELRWVRLEEIELDTLCEADRTLVQFMKSFHK